jgi:2-aminoadipate transaminase
MMKKQHVLSRRMQGMSGNVVREILKLTQSPDIISFAGGLPSPDSFPVEELRNITAELFTGDTSFLQYGITEGLPGLREFAAGWVNDFGIQAKPENVLVLSGSQQGIDLACKALINPGDVILVEQPTYLAALQIFQTYEAQVVEVAGDEEGMLPDALAEAIRRYHPRMVYVIPTFQNPSGICWSLERRQALSQAAAEHDFIILEDDPYGRLRYSGTHVPAIAGIDGLQRSIYLGSFSKVIAPGLRVGYAIAPPELLQPMVVGKQGTDVHTSNLSQQIIMRYAHKGGFDQHLPKVRAQYGEKCQLMLQSLAKHFPAASTWTKPQGGLFLWVTLKDVISTTALLEQAIAAKVAFIPGTPFSATGGCTNCMRLNFSNASLANIETGIERIAQVIKDSLDR